MAAVALTCALLFGACASSDAEPAEEAPAEVAIDTFVFAPKNFTIERGTTVRWTNGDEILHTVTSGEQTRQGVPGVEEDRPARPNGTFDLELDGKGTTASFTFDEAGTFTYFCRVHAAMKARVTVE